MADIKKDRQVRFYWNIKRLFRQKANFNMLDVSPWYTWTKRSPSSTIRRAKATNTTSISTNISSNNL